MVVIPVEEQGIMMVKKMVMKIMALSLMFPFAMTTRTVSAFHPPLYPSRSISLSSSKKRRRTIPLQSSTVTPPSPPASIPTTISSSPVTTTATTKAADDDDDDAFSILAMRTAQCLWESELRRDAKQPKQSTDSTTTTTNNNWGSVASGATNWIDDASSYMLQQVLDQMDLSLDAQVVAPPAATSSFDRDQASMWLRWMKGVPCPAIIDVSSEMRQIVNTTFLLGDNNKNSINKQLNLLDETRDNFLRRIGCRIVLFPSGASLSQPLVEPPGSLTFGKLLFGGVTRYRLLPSSGSHTAPLRKAAERTTIRTSNNNNARTRTRTARAKSDIPPSWVLYGGPNRMYEAVDMGPAAVLEVQIVPRGQQAMKNTKAAQQRGNGAGINSNNYNNNMIIQSIRWNPQWMFDFPAERSPQDAEDGDVSSSSSFSNPSYMMSGKTRNDAFRSGFQSSVGGLQPQIDAIVRRVLDGRIIRPADVADRLQQQQKQKQHQKDKEKASSTNSNSNNLSSTLDDDDEYSRALSRTALEAEELALLGLTPVRGLLLYGPPGCGKTALAREISRALRARAPKIIAAPELLDRWVGGSEKAVRALFMDAESELAVCGDDPTQSALHVIVIDEIDAVFRRRTSAEDTGEATRSSVVNQILAKLDGVNAIPNVLVIGMTNRRELLDEALIRPGRLEVQIEIPLPNREGRREILQIHFGALREKGRLSLPLCQAIDGSRNDSNDSSSSSSNSGTVSKRPKMRDSFRTAIRNVLMKSSGYHYDLAEDYATGGFSGADIAGLVRCAGSIALARARKDGSGVEGLLITLEDVKQALTELRLVIK